MNELWSIAQSRPKESCDEKVTTLFPYIYKE